MQPGLIVEMDDQTFIKHLLEKDQELFVFLTINERRRLEKLLETLQNSEKILRKCFREIKDLGIIEFNDNFDD